MNSSEIVRGIIKEVNSGRAYKEEINLYENVKRNENFFIGRQWEGVVSPKGLDKPVMNILKRVISYFVSMIHSDDIAISIKPLYNRKNADFEKSAEILTNEIEAAIELCGLKRKNRDAVRNAAVDGDCCCYIAYNPSVKAGGGKRGGIEAELIENVNVIFGNPQSSEVEKQPYIIVIAKKTVEWVAEELRRRGAKCEISADKDKKLNVYTRFYKKDGVVYATACTDKELIYSDICMEYERYPIAWMCWDKVKNSYHGQAAISGLIPNQVFVNKLYAMAMQNARLNAFPKVIYNENLLPEGFSNNIGQAIGVCGDPNQAVAASFRAADMSSQVIELIERTIADTKDCMGANDVLLGNVNPTNTSAIVALQQSSAMPLELYKQAYYEYVEDIVRIMAEIIHCRYGKREIYLLGAEGKDEKTAFDFSKAELDNMLLNVDIGAASYFSEIMQVQTLDSLMQLGIIPNARTYLEAVPDRYLKNKQRILAEVEKNERENKNEVQEL